MTIYAFSSFSYSYLDRARVLCRSLRQYHPDWHLCAVVTDRPPSGVDPSDLLNEFDSALSAEDLLKDELGDGFEAWLFQHNVVEACTAVKGRAMQWLMSRPDAEKVFFFDPDIAIFNRLDPLVKALDEDDILLTPHQIQHEARDHRTAIGDNEIASLKWGTYNLGFIGVSNRPDSEGRRFAAWWGDRLMDWCQDNVPQGLFTDQKWCDLVPAFFDNVRVFRDPGCNVASWNLSQRQVAFTQDGEISVNEAPLRFFHFTKLGPIGDQMTRRYAYDNAEVLEVWAWYKRAVAGAVAPDIPSRYWHYGCFSSGQAIPDAVRVLYRDRADLRAAFPRPFDTTDGFVDWLQQKGHLPRFEPLSMSA